MTDRPYMVDVPDVVKGDRVGFADRDGVVHVGVVADNVEDPPGTFTITIEDGDPLTPRDLLAELQLSIDRVIHPDGTLTIGDT